jgi:hypothetical protein
MARLVAIALLLVTCAVFAGRNDVANPARSDDASSMPPVIIVGFVGGFVRPDDSVHGVVQFAQRLRSEFGSTSYIEVVENHREEKAHQDILRLLDAKHAGSPTESERKQARVIIYGHSWGGSETVMLARELDKDGIPVLLTVQVDSISKHAENDAIIPANVMRAVNFYQLNGLMHGRSEIRAANPALTKIENVKFDYSSYAPNCDLYPWYDRVFMKAHTQMESDPKVWDRVESLIRSTIEQDRKTAAISRDPS